MKATFKTSSFQTFLIASLITCLLLNSCSKSETETSKEKGLVTIDLVKAYDDRGEIKMSDFASSVEYIPLETSEETFYKTLNVIDFLGDSALIIMSTDRISLFDQNSGRYIRDIAHQGEDPEGFSRTMRDLRTNRKHNTIYAGGKQQDIYEYDLNSGKLANKIPQPTSLAKDPNSESIFDISLIGNYATLNDEYIVGSFLNLRGNEPLKLMIYDFDGNVVKTYPNRQSFEKKSNSIFITKSSFHHFNNELFFKERFNDTIYNVGLDTLEAAYYFSSGSYSPPYEEQENLGPDGYKKYMFINNAFENKDHLFFNMSYNEFTQWGIFNKKTGETFVAKASTSHPTIGYTNDIDNFVPFYPTFINHKGELVGLIKAEEVAEWFLENPDKISSLPPHLQKLKDVDPEANPIVMIAKPK